MTDDKISQDLRRFILQHFRSVEEVEVLILLQKDPAREWTASELSQAMTSSITSIEKRLADLCATGLVDGQRHEKEFRYRYHPKDSVWRKHAEELARSYPKLRLRITQIIYEGPEERIRNFADAFRLKEDKDHA